MDQAQVDAIIEKLDSIDRRLTIGLDDICNRIEYHMDPGATAKTENFVNEIGEAIERGDRARVNDLKRLLSQKDRRLVRVERAGKA